MYIKRATTGLYKPCECPAFSFPGPKIPGFYARITVIIRQSRLCFPLSEWPIFYAKVSSSGYVRNQDICPSPYIVVSGGCVMCKARYKNYMYGESLGLDSNG